MLECAVDKRPSKEAESLQRRFLEALFGNETSETIEHGDNLRFARLYNVLCCCSQASLLDEQRKPLDATSLSPALVLEEGAIVEFGALLRVDCVVDVISRTSNRGASLFCLSSHCAPQQSAFSLKSSRALMTR